jgi:hypothetical protein
MMNYEIGRVSPCYLPTGLGLLHLNAPEVVPARTFRSEGMEQ